MGRLTHVQPRGDYVPTPSDTLNPRPDRPIGDPQEHLPRRDIELLGLLAERALGPAGHRRRDRGEDP